ncbi:MAG TPA: glycosyltransferase family 4 protein [bacterium]|nr:glycosyltransferase family 4 protein [bacterium]
MKNVVFWMSSYLPELGGFQWSTFRLARALKNNGWNVLIVTKKSDEGGFPPEIPVKSFTADNLMQWVEISGKWLIDNRDKFDVIHVIDLFYHSIDPQFAVLAKLARPTVLKIPTAACLPRIINDSNIGYLNFIDAFSALNEQIIDELVSLKVSTDRIYLFPNGLDCQEFKPAIDKTDLRARMNLPTNDILVLYVGRLVRRKRLDVLLDVFDRIGTKAKLLLVGAGFDQKDSVEDEIIERARKMENVLIFPATPNVLGYYNCCDIHTLISEVEGMPNSIIESMACALPNVATNISGVRELITSGVNGFLVPIGDSDATFQAILNLINNPALRAEMGQVSRNKIMAEFSIDLIAKKYINLYLKLLEEKNESNLNYPI